MLLKTHLGWIWAFVERKRMRPTFHRVLCCRQFQTSYYYRRRHHFQGLLTPSRSASPDVSALQNTSAYEIRSGRRPSGPSDKRSSLLSLYKRPRCSSMPFDQRHKMWSCQPRDFVCRSNACFVRYAADSRSDAGGLVHGLNPHLLVEDRHTHLEMRP